MSDFTDFLIDGPDRPRKKPKKARRCVNFDICGKRVSPHSDEKQCYWCIKAERCPSCGGTPDGPFGCEDCMVLS
jgi:hypothetical protein